MKPRLIRAAPGAPTVYLIDERHSCDECTDDNITTADRLFETGVVLAGVEGYEGGREYDEYSRAFTSTRVPRTISPDSEIGSYPRFAEGLLARGREVVGVDSRGLCNEIECDLTAQREERTKSGEASKEIGAALSRGAREHPNQRRRSNHFIRTLFMEYTERGMKGDLVLNCGAHHNDHIEEVVASSAPVPDGWPDWNYVRIRSARYPVDKRTL